ncbi:hypothetical protein BV22DRAFT_1122039 [Leucogyrophana mollusca]|uniref:Uncharacterized protein n=1 Tax=Leucogyrophana mollusca TaxID=85980 RepID=A0ACB8B8P7_9AGAM|nr:hypothetical protein BV22DRAFT_1122039 [Leucogyrophana mollusca]
MATYGRNRQSIADIEQQLYQIFNDHPDADTDTDGEPRVPADALVDVLRAFSDAYNGVELLDDSEMEGLKQLLAANPTIQVTPHMLLQFVAARTGHSPDKSPRDEPLHDEDLTMLPERGRDPLWTHHPNLSRNSSRDSAGTSRVPSRPPSVPPKTPISASGPSPFDTSRRQRAADVAPSSWTKRPAPAHRRKSIDGNSRALSDSESSSFSSSTSSFRRSRAPSSPTSPISSGLFSPTFSPPSRPHSRAQSQPFNSIAFYTSPDRDPHSGDTSPDADASFDYPTRHDDHNTNIMDSISSLPMPRSASDSDSDREDEDESALGLVLDRSAASSTASLAPLDRLDALQKANADLARKLVDAERTLQNKLLEHDVDLDEMQGRIDELRSELTATKREEKELRGKERTNSTQIAALESEIAKLQKSLENARTSYQSLQKQYQEQCAESERYRNHLRRRDESIKDYADAAALHVLEAAKWDREHERYEERLAHAAGELAVAQQAHAQLDEQKQENLMLKETIDRMRYDMDEMRSAASAVGGGGPGSGASSAANSMSKSLGAELMGKMGAAGWGMEDEGEEEDAEEGGAEEGEESEGEGTEGEEEDVIQTIITRKKRKITGRANKDKDRVETITFSETKEYCDASVQHDVPTAASEVQTDATPTSTSAVQTSPSAHSVHTETQTDAPTPIYTSETQIQTQASLFAHEMQIQTDPEPEPEKVQTQSFAVQTETAEKDPELAPLPRITMSVDIQTEPEYEHEISRSPSPHSISAEEEDALASSSSTVLPPTPKAPAEHEHAHTDLPPSYHSVAEQDQDASADDPDWRVLKKWHKGLKIPFEGRVQLSADAVEEWRALKDDLGVECAIIDKLVETSSAKAGRSRRNRFYNIYNTYVYGGSGKAGGDEGEGDGDGGPLASIPLGAAKQLLFCATASACVYLCLGPYMAAQSAPVGPTYYDRAAWSSFNSMQAPGEGFGYDGTAALWNIVGRVGFGAARIAGGWPT